MKFSLTLDGGLGDFILRYLGSPGNRLAHILSVCPGEVQLRVSATQLPGHDLLLGNPFFPEIVHFIEKPMVKNNLPNDISLIQDLHQYRKLTPPLWLDDHEDAILRSLPRPYGVFHPFASGQHRNLAEVFDLYQMAQWTADVAGIPLYVLGREEFRYASQNVRPVKGSTRLSVLIVEGASFFVGTHSSMQCAAWVHNIPSLCIGPSHLLFHDAYRPDTFETYLKPLFGKNVFLMYEQAGKYPQFLDHFLRTATALSPRKSPEECRTPLSLLDKALGTVQS